jgi:hypothetical protein
MRLTGAAAAVLSYLFPDRALLFAKHAEEATRSRLLAGVSYPSDVAAGLEIGHRVAQGGWGHRTSARPHPQTRANHTRPVQIEAIHHGRDLCPR